MYYGLDSLTGHGYKAALYIRLSKEDDNELESQSITNQRSMLLSFTDKNNIEVFDIYVDDGWSGTDFNRPGFNRMIADIEKKKVNMVVTKDLSRLGRDYIQTGYYIERYFPENRVRYISLLDGIDTGVDSAANEITPFRALMNDMYAKDISKKIKSVKRDKQKKGLFIGGKAAYGYRKSKERNKIEIDETAAQVIQKIFKLAIEGKSCRQIAAHLNRERIPPPAVYAGLKTAGGSPHSGLWSSERISEILQNQIYIGNMVQGKTRKISYKSRKCIRMDKKDWIVVENTHEPIIERKIFEKVQAMLASRKRTRERTYNYLLKGIIYCHECGYPMAVINRPNAAGEDTLYLICRTYQRFTKLGKCTSHLIKESSIKNIVLEKVNQVLNEFCDKKQLNFVVEKMLKKRDLTNIERIKPDELVEKFLSGKKLERNIIVTLIERIEITEDKQIIIHFRFKEPESDAYNNRDDMYRELKKKR